LAAGSGLNEWFYNIFFLGLAPNTNEHHKKEPKTNTYRHHECKKKHNTMDSDFITDLTRPTERLYLF
jgi:hypothetical protein